MAFQPSGKPKEYKRLSIAFLNVPLAAYHFAYIGPLCAPPTVTGDDVITSYFQGGRPARPGHNAPNMSKRLRAGKEGFSSLRKECSGGLPAKPSILSVFNASRPGLGYHHLRNAVVNCVKEKGVHRWLTYHMLTTIVWSK